MVFSSYLFIFGFFPGTLIGYHLLRLSGRVTWAKLWLVAASLVFYGVGQPDFLLWFMVSIGLNYLILIGLKHTGCLSLRRLLLFTATCWNVGLLVYFKYTNFFLENINWLLHTDIALLSVALPIGISFFTFQILAYTVSYYSGECEFPSILDYAVFVTFFPQLIVGPVVKHDEIFPQIEGKKLLHFDRINIYRGVMLFSVGCAKKVLLANTMIDYATAFYSGNVADFSLIETWFGVLSYVFAYYFDFSGYIDMARGLGCFFGIELPANFDSPYQARDFADFWRRWNITISRFFNESVFSHIFRFGDGILKLILATLATFAVSGLWHGADWHYIAWGIANGLLVCVANIRALRDSRPLPAWLGILITFFLGALIRVLFDSNGMTQAVQIYQKIFDYRILLDYQALLASGLLFLRENAVLVITMVISAGLCFFAPNSNRIMEKVHFSGWTAAASAVLLALSLFNMTKVSTFLYFNF